MKKISRAEYESWKEGAKVLEEDRYGEKVLHLPDGTFIKLFRRKRWLSKTTLRPPAKRFADNAAELQRLGIRGPAVIGLYQMENPYRTIVHYLPLEGATLRQLLNSEPSLEQIELFAQLAEFITTLHDLGIYFRSLHLGNIVRSSLVSLVPLSVSRGQQAPSLKSPARPQGRHPTAADQFREPIAADCNPGLNKLAAGQAWDSPA